MSNLILACSEPAAGAGGVLDQAAQVDQGERPLLGPEPLDQVVTAEQAALLTLGAPAGLEVAVLLARDQHGPGRGRPVLEELGARALRRLGIGGRFGFRWRRGGAARLFRMVFRAPDISQQGHDQAHGGERPVRGSGHRHPFRNEGDAPVSFLGGVPRQRQSEDCEGRKEEDRLNFAYFGDHSNDSRRSEPRQGESRRGQLPNHPAGTRKLKPTRSPCHNLAPLCASFLRFGERLPDRPCPRRVL